MKTICTIPGQPTITIARDYSEALALFSRVAEYQGIDSAVHFGGTTVVAGNTVIGYCHDVSDYNGVIALKSAAELDANGYRPHAEAIRRQVGQAEAMVRNPWDTESNIVGKRWLADIAEESAEAAIEYHIDPNN
jgi:hypothetical protein